MVEDIKLPFIQEHSHDSSHNVTFYNMDLKFNHDNVTEKSEQNNKTVVFQNKSINQPEGHRQSRLIQYLQDIKESLDLSNDDLEIANKQSQLK